MNLFWGVRGEDGTNCVVWEVITVLLGMFDSVGAFSAPPSIPALFSSVFVLLGVVSSLSCLFSPFYLLEDILILCFPLPFIPLIFCLIPLLFYFILLYSFFLSSCFILCCAFFLSLSLFLLLLLMMLFLLSSLPLFLLLLSWCLFIFLLCFLFIGWCEGRLQIPFIYDRGIGPAPNPSPLSLYSTNKVIFRPETRLKPCCLLLIEILLPA